MKRGTIGSMKISNAASSIWAKLGRDCDGRWLPLHVHMCDTVSVSLHLWDEWLPESTKRLLLEQICDKGGCSPRELIAFLAASHDIGKATPAFQAKVFKAEGAKPIADRLFTNGLGPRRDLSNPSAVKHATSSMKILERNRIDPSLSVIVGGHHGMPPSINDVDKIFAYRDNTGFSSPSWVAVQDEFFNLAVAVSGVDVDWLREFKVPVQSQVLLTGILIMADWMASNELAFPLINLENTDVEDTENRGQSGWKSFGFKGHEGMVYGSRSVSFDEAFGFEPRDFQRVAIEAAEGMSSPGMIIIEAPTGEGKTEAALAISEIFASKFGQSGLYFALPTQATADSVFSRVESWVRRCSGEGTRTMFLAHGKSRFNQDFAGIAREGEWNIGGDTFQEDNLVVNEWMSGKKGLLSDIVVGTVDQILMAGLKKKHIQLRHLGLSGKVVVIDECHAYDEYMGSYLCKALRWLGSYRVPVIVMSATLPPGRRAEVAESYLGRSLEPDELDDTEVYPLLTCVSPEGVKCYMASASSRGRTVAVERIRDVDVVPELKMCLVEGGYAGVIVNTVGRAQMLYDEIVTAFPGDDVYLLHSAFTASDRVANEKRAMDALSRVGGSRGGCTIVVGTQVLEQSLDIDFDVLITDICPVDLLIQRIGRLHRHANERPRCLESPRCYVVDSGDGSIESGTEAVYGAYQILNTRLLVGSEIVIPEDVPGLVARAYSDGGVIVPLELEDEYSKAKRDKDEAIRSKEAKAKVYQIKAPEKSKNMLKWLEYPSDKSDLGAEETVRDTDGSVEAVLVCRRGDGSFCMFSDDFGCPGELIPSGKMPGPAMAYKVAGCRLTLPHRFIAMHGVEDVVKTLFARNSKEIPRCWRESPWLSRELFLVCDEDGRMEFMGVEMKYCSRRGLRYV